MTLVPRKYGRLKTTSYSSSWKREASSDVVCLVLLPRQTRWRLASVISTKPIYLSVFAPLILLIAIVVRLTSAKYHYNHPVSFDLGNPWIPVDFLSNYTFNGQINQCQNHHLTSTAPSLPAAAVVSNSNKCGSSSNKQCLFPDLEYSLRWGKFRRRFCDMMPKLKSSQRERSLKLVSLDYCHNYTLDDVLSDKNRNLVVNGTHSQCVSILEELVMIDNKVHVILCEFEHLLSRYDCQRQYSAKWTCQHCQDAYKDWACSMFLPFHYRGHHFKPCRRFCKLIEQRCPYFLPGDKKQYAGEPAFFCIDPNIPDTPDIASYSSYSIQRNCYEPCHVSKTFKNSDIPDNEKDCEPPQIPNLLVHTSSSSSSSSSTYSSFETSSSNRHTSSIITSSTSNNFDKSGHDSALASHSNSDRTYSTDNRISLSVLSSSSSSIWSRQSAAVRGYLVVPVIVPLLVTLVFFQTYCKNRVELVKINNRRRTSQRLKIIDSSPT